MTNSRLSVCWIVLSLWCEWPEKEANVSLCSPLLFHSPFHSSPYSSLLTFQPFTGSTTNIPTLTTTVDVLSDDTCTVLERIASRQSRAPGGFNFNCLRNQQCDRVDCTANFGISRYRSSLVILACQLPQPAVHIDIVTPNGVALVNETVTNSERVSLLELLRLNITLDQLQNAIGLQVQLLDIVCKYSLVSCIITCCTLIIIMLCFHLSKACCHVSHQCSHYCHWVHCRSNRHF